MPDTPAGPVFPVVFDEPSIAEDLAHHPARRSARTRTASPRIGS